MKQPDVDATLRWRKMDAADRSAAYSPSSVLPDRDLMPFIQRYVDFSVAAYAQCPDVQTLGYGPLPSQTVDLVVPDNVEPVPLHVFFHGGYWQELSKKESFFPATDTLARGAAFAAVDYTLAPDATLDDIVTECRAAFMMLRDGAIDMGIDPHRIVVSGSSAGAHLAAVVCSQLPLSDRPKGLLLLSGIYVLEPLIGTYINDPLKLDVAAAHRLSPALLPADGFPETVIAWGMQETDEFKRQSMRYAAHLRASKVKTTTIEMPDRNHFDIVEDIANQTTLGRHLAQLLDV